VIPMTNDWLCISLNLSVPVTFHVTVDLVTNANTKTVYTVENIVGETLATDIVTIFEVHVDAVQSRFSQLVVYVSQGTVIRNVDIQNEQCKNASKCITRLHGSVRLLLRRPAMSLTYYNLIIRYMDFSYLGLFVPWTVRTLLDGSYNGLFVPFLDDSYHVSRLTKINTLMMDVSYQNVPMYKLCQKTVLLLCVYLLLEFFTTQI